MNTLGQPAEGCFGSVDTAGLLKPQPGRLDLLLQRRTFGRHQIDEHQLTSGLEAAGQGRQKGQFAAVIG